MSDAGARRDEGHARRIPINGPADEADEALPSSSELAAARVEEILKRSAEATEAPPEAMVELPPAAELMEKLRRVKADFANYQRRMEAERQRWRAAGRREAVLGMLPALDQLEITAASAGQHEDIEGLRSALDLVLKEVHRFLKSTGVERMEPVGEIFDPEIHEALFSRPTDEVGPGIVLEEVRAGFLLEENVLRPSQVVVSAASPSAPDGDGNESAPPDDEGKKEE